MLVPTVLAMVICDAVWRDPETGKPTLLGAFAQLAAVAVPVERAQVCVYAQLSGHQGWATIRADLYQTDGDLDADDAPITLATAGSPVYFVDRAATVDVALTMYNVDLPVFGEYYFTLSMGDAPLAERRLWVVWAT